MILKKEGKLGGLEPSLQRDLGAEHLEIREPSIPENGGLVRSFQESNDFTNLIVNIAAKFADILNSMHFVDKTQKGVRERGRWPPGTPSH